MTGRFALLATACLLAGAIPAAAQSAPADVLISGGSVYTGGDAPAIKADVVLAGDKIIYVGADGARKYHAGQVIDARGRVVSPGFIDIG